MQKKDVKLVYDAETDSVVRSDGIQKTPIEESAEDLLEEIEDYQRMLEDEHFSEVSTAELIGLINVLSNGYIKPDVRDHSSLDGVRDTKRFFPIIEVCFEEFLARLGKTKIEVLAIINKTRNINDQR